MRLSGTNPQKFFPSDVKLSMEKWPFREVRKVFSFFHKDLTDHSLVSERKKGEKDFTAPFGLSDNGRKAMHHLIHAQ